MNSQHFSDRENPEPEPEPEGRVEVEVEGKHYEWLINFPFSVINKITPYRSNFLVIQQYGFSDLQEY